MAAVRIVCKRPSSIGYTLDAKTVADAERKIAAIEAAAVVGYKGTCSGPHAVECWVEGAWVEVSDGD